MTRTEALHSVESGADRQQIITEQSIANQQTTPAKERYIVVFYHGWDKDDIDIDYERADFIRRKLTNEVKSTKENTEIDLWLDSPGGIAHSAYKIIMIIRSFCSKFRVIIPDYAKSAATIMAIAADELYMSPYAELGPLDAQIQHPDRENLYISALDYANALDHLAQVAIRTVVDGGAIALRATKLTRKEIFLPMLDFGAKFLEPSVQKLDPSLIAMSAKALKVAEEYVKRLLKPMFMKYRNDSIRTEKLRRLPRHLWLAYTSHGFVVNREEARELGLDVLDLEGYIYKDEAIWLCDRIKDSQGHRFEVVKADKLITDINKVRIPNAGSI